MCYLTRVPGANEHRRAAQAKSNFEETRMKKIQLFVAVIMLSIAGAFLGLAQQPAQTPPQPMSFFITSAGSGKGANLGGLAGADKICQTLATAAGSTKTFHAYLSTGGSNAVNARDRIGNGPWYNAKGQRIAQSVAELHGDTIEQARLGNALGKQLSLSEKQGVVNVVGDTPNQHDILTGSQPDGRAYTDTMDHTCNNWTSIGIGIAQL